MHLSFILLKPVLLICCRLVPLEYLAEMGVDTLAYAPIQGLICLCPSVNSSDNRSLGCKRTVP